MPMIRCRIEPTRLLSNNDAASTLDDSVNSICANVIRQLSNLSLVSRDMFDELLSDLSHVTERAMLLNNRVLQLRETTARLNAVSEEVSLDDLASRQPYKSSALKDASLNVRPNAVAALYLDAEALPALDRLNPFRQDGKDCIKLYTNPDYFFELWSSQIKQEVERKKPMRKKARDKAEQVTVRLPTSNVERLQTKVQDGLGTISRPPKPSVLSTSSQQPSNGSCKPQNDDFNNNPSKTSPRQVSSAESNLTRQFSTSRPPQEPSLPPPPPPPPPMSISNRAATLPPTPTIPVMRNTSVSRSGSKGKSIYSVTEFDRAESMFLPPPPPLPIGQLPYLVEEDDCVTELPPAPFVPTPPPPPPAAPPIGAMSTGFALRRPEGSAIAVQNLKKRETRGDLLHSIKTGIQLRKVTEQAPVAGGGAKPAVGGGVFDVQAILEMRRRAFEDDDDDDEGGDDWVE